MREAEACGRFQRTIRMYMASACDHWQIKMIGDGWVRRLGVAATQTRKEEPAAANTQNGAASHVM